MFFNDTPLGLVAQDIRNAAEATAFAHYGLVIHTEQGDVEVFRLLNVDELSDFVTKYCKTTTVTGLVATGAYKFKVLPSISHLEASLQIRYYNPFRPGVVGHQVLLNRFTAQLLGSSGDPIDQDGHTQVGEATEDLASHTPVKLQLFDKVIEQFDTRSFGTIARRTDVQSLIKTVLVGESGQVDVDAEYTPLGVDMVPPNDAELREHILIPPMPSRSVPEYIHRHCGGVYSAGLSYFFHEGMWYVYPTYDYTRFNEASKQLTIIITPSKAMPNQEFTFMNSSKALTILATGDISTMDHADQKQLRLGNGVRFIDPRALNGDGIKVADNKVTMDPTKSVNEFITKPRINGLNKVTPSANTITANRLYEMSKMAARDGKRVMLTWQNANPALLLPGMQTKILYMQNNIIRELRAVLLGVETSVQYTGRTLVSGNYSTNCALVLHVDRQEVA